MDYSPILIFHISAGTIALLSGVAALTFRKGSRPHRVAGNVFFISMLSLSASGIYIAYMKTIPGSVVGGLFTFYLVATAWATVKRKEGEIGLFEKGAALFALVFSAGAFILGIEAANSGREIKGGIPLMFFFIVGTLAALAAVFDIRMIYRGGIYGAKRILRHHGRMCGALFIAAASIFTGNPQVFPEAVRESNILLVPVIAVILVGIFWQIRVRFTNWYKNGH